MGGRLGTTVGEPVAVAVAVGPAAGVGEAPGEAPGDGEGAGAAPPEVSCCNAVKRIGSPHTIWPPPPARAIFWSTGIGLLDDWTYTGST